MEKPAIGKEIHAHDKYVSLFIARILAQLIYALKKLFL